jgi:hypothetical protein
MAASASPPGPAERTCRPKPRHGRCWPLDGPFHVLCLTDCLAEEAEPRARPAPLTPRPRGYRQMSA